MDTKLLLRYTCWIFITQLVIKTGGLQFEKPKIDYDVISIPENATVGSAVFEFIVKNFQGNVDFSLKAKPEVMATFGLNDARNGTAYLILKQSLQLGKSLGLDCSAKDLNQTVTRHVFIKIEDVNDNFPIFKEYNRTIEFAENTWTENNSPLFTVRAYDDQDTNLFGTLGIKFSLKSEQSFNVFYTNWTDGVDEKVFHVYLNQQFDFESTSVYRLSITAFDNDGNFPSLSSTISILINVQDQDDMKPTFVKIPSINKLPENSPQGEFVFEIKAIDGDRGINNPIVYSITDGNVNDSFELDNLTGIVVVKNSPNREELGEGEIGFVLTIQASEQLAKQSLGLKEIVQCTVIILDENDEFPEFDRNEYSGRVTENSISNFAITLDDIEYITVTDLDQSENARFKVSVNNDKMEINHRQLFLITPANGINQGYFTVRVNDSSRLDYEELGPGPLRLVVDAVDTKNSTLNSSVVVAVTITDANDLYPQFTEFNYSKTVPEDAGEGFVVFTVNATDGDTGNFGTDGIVYSIIGSQSVLEAFDVNTKTGDVFVKSNNSLDREKTEMYTFTILARDNFGQGNSNSTNVVIRLIDVNDNEPQFAMKSYKTSLFENDVAFQIPLYLKAVDDDIGENGRVGYRIINGVGNYFELKKSDENSVEFSVHTALDYEVVCRDIAHSCNLNVSVQTFDYGIPSLATSTTINIILLDVNDEQPTFVLKEIHVTLKETDEHGVSVTTVSASDADVSPSFNRVSYQITDGSRSLFSIDSKRGNITVSRNGNLDLDLTGISEYILTVVARDGGDWNAEAICRVKVTVLDVNNKPPKFINFPYETGVKEDVQINTVLNVDVKATDSDQDHRLSYSVFDVKGFGPNNRVFADKMYIQRLFVVDGVKGEVKVNSELDRETVERVEMILIVVDEKSEAGPQNATATLTITIVDVNDNAPWFGKREYYGSVMENSDIWTEILPSVTAIDRDLDQIVTFRLSGDTECLQLVNITEDGILYVISNIDRERIASIIVNVSATDNGVPPLANSTMYNITVLDQNDNPPVFERENETCEAFLSEDVPVGTFVYKVRATDPDLGDNGKVGYLLQSGQPEFNIDFYSGEIRVAGKLDRDSGKSVVQVVVEARDNYNKSEYRTATTIVLVNISDVNDNHPKIIRQEGCKSVKEDVEMFHEILELNAIDPDAGENGTVQFSIKSVNPPEGINLFAIKSTMGNPNPNWLISNGLLFGWLNGFDVTIGVTDLGQPEQLIGDPVTFKICIIDVNNDPVIRAPMLNKIFRIREDSKIDETIVFRIDAIDDDLGDNAKLVYTVTAHGDVFKANLTTGDVILVGELNREIKKWYQIEFRVCDQGSPKPLCVEGKCRVVVTDVNDNPPYFQQIEMMVEFIEETAPGENGTWTEILEAIDDDDAFIIEDYLRIPICYYILEGNKDRPFVLNRHTRKLHTTKRLDFESQPTYEISVYPTNDCENEKPNTDSIMNLENYYLTISITVQDVNDHIPVFTQKVFGGGIENSNKPGKKIVRLNATDVDAGENAKPNYFMASSVILEQFDNMHSDVNPDSWFNLNNETGDVILNFQFHKNVRGYLEFKVGVNNSRELHNSTSVVNGNSSSFATVKIYVLRGDQKSSFTIRLSPEKFESVRESFARTLTNLTGYMASVDSVEYYTDPRTGTSKSEWCEVFVHYVNLEDNIVVDPAIVEELLDEDVEAQMLLATQFKVYEVMKHSSEEDEEIDTVKIILYASIAILIGLLSVVAVLYQTRMKRLERQLKVSMLTPYSPGKNGDRKFLEIPNTNLHSQLGSNPIYNLDGENNQMFESSVEKLSVQSETGSLVDGDFEGGKNNGGFVSRIENMFPNDEITTARNGFDVQSATDDRKSNRRLEINVILQQEPSSNEITDV